MPKFYIPAAAAAEAGTGSGVGPAHSDYFAVECIGIDAMTGEKFQEGTFRLSLQFETGDEAGELITVGHDAAGVPIRGVQAEKVANRTKFLNGLFESFGFGAEQRNAGGYTDEWLLGATGYVEWHSAEDRGAQFGKVARWIAKAAYDAAKAAGRRPLVAKARGTAPASQPVHASPPAAPKPPSAPPAGNGAPTRVAPRPPAPPTVRGV